MTYSNSPGGTARNHGETAPGPPGGYSPPGPYDPRGQQPTAPSPGVPDPGALPPAPPGPWYPPAQQQFLPARPGPGNRTLAIWALIVVVLAVVLGVLLWLYSQPKPSALSFGAASAAAGHTPSAAEPLSR